MYQRVDAPSMEALFLPINRRKPTVGVYFVRIGAYGDDVRTLLWRYHEAAAAKGVIIEQGLANPDEHQLTYLRQTLGDGFECTQEFVLKALNRWMPRMTDADRRLFAEAMLSNLEDLRRQGKTDSTLKSIYAKLMCWLYYRFERLVPQLGQDEPPRILYEDPGSFSRDGLVMLRLLSALGADVLVFHTAGQQSYLKQDPEAKYSQMLELGSGDFPQGFTLKQFRKEMQNTSRNKPTPAQNTYGEQASSSAAGPTTPAMVSQPAQKAPAPHMGMNFTPPSQRPQEKKPAPQPVQPGQSRINFTPPSQRQTSQPVPEIRNGGDMNALLRSRFPQPARANCLNAWMNHPEYDEIATPPHSRGDAEKMLCHALIRVTGVPDKLTYTNELYQFYQKLESSGRKLLILEGLPEPSTE